MRELSWPGRGPRQRAAASGLVGALLYVVCLSNAADLPDQELVAPAAFAYCK